MRRYPKYKNSGVEWLGEIPFEWDTVKIKFTDKLIMGQSPESKDVTDFEKGTPFLQGNAEFTDTHPTPKNWCVVPNKTANKNDILLSVRAPVGEINIADQTYGIGRGLCAIRPKKNLLKYLYYILSISKEELNKVSTGTTFVAITIPNLSNVIIPKVGIIEQQSIVNFLDYKTNQIDQFIANRQKQIELFKEQKKGIINKAVTKGINPNAKMKNSGIEWIGNVPEHWDVWKLKFLTKKIGSGVTPLGGADVYKTEGIAFFRSQNIYNDRFEISNISFIEEAIHLGMKNSMVIPGDVLLNITGASIGRCFYFTNEYPEANVNQHVCIIRANKNILFRFLHSVLISEIGQNQIFSKQSGSNREGLNFEQIKQFDIPLPPKIEQQNILEFINKETTNIDTLISKYQKQIDLMQEYRTALISQAVTGKIDVRKWKPKSN